MRQRPLDILSNDNTLFCTEQCNNHCLMCCQPPMNVDDINQLYEENLLRIQNAPKDLPIIGITGGEPTLLGDKLISLVKRIREQLPDTDIHVLSNGRNFKDSNYASALVESGEGRIIFGIPIHSDFYRDHDIISGAKGAFEETITGLYNLASVGACIELRIVMHKLNYKRFQPLAEFIHKNLLDFRNRGGAVLLISSELSEIMSLSDRVIVMYKGAIIGEVDPRKVSREDIGLLMAGAKPKGDEVHG